MRLASLSTPTYKAGLQASSANVVPPKTDAFTPSAKAHRQGFADAKQVKTLIRAIEAHLDESCIQKFTHIVQKSVFRQTPLRLVDQLEKNYLGIKHSYKSS